MGGGDSGGGEVGVRWEGVVIKIWWGESTEGESFSRWWWGVGGWGGVSKLWAGGEILSGNPSMEDTAKRYVHLL